MYMDVQEPEEGKICGDGGKREHHTSCARTTESYPASVRVWGKHTLDAESTVPCWRDSLQTALTSYSYHYGWYVAKKTFQETD